jgi:hypothetical protein
MVYRLAEDVQVRKESWGLLFYQQLRHKVYFVRSGDWLYPRHFDGSWTFHDMVGDIGRRTGTPAEITERSIQKLTGHLLNNRMIINELC